MQRHQIGAIGEGSDLVGRSQNVKVCARLGLLTWRRGVFTTTRCMQEPLRAVPGEQTGPSVDVIRIFEGRTSKFIERSDLKGMVCVGGNGATRLRKA